MRKKISIIFFCLLIGGFFISSQSVHAAGSSLTQHWKLDEGIQGTDPINYGSIAEPTVLGGGGPTYSADVPTTSFHNSYSAVFNGIDQYIQADTSVSGSFSISFWFKTASSGPAISHFYQGSGMVDAEHESIDDWGISWGNQKVAFGMNAHGPSDITIFSSSTLTLSQWHHVVGTWSNLTGVMALWVDGVFNTSTFTTTFSRQVNEMRIGGTQTGTHFFDGKIDDVRIYNSILSTSSIVALAAGGPPPAPTNFIGAASTTNAILSWTNPTSSFSSVTVRRDTATYPVFTTDGTIIANGPTSTGYTDSSLADNHYYYSIFALDAGGNESVAATTSVVIDTTAPTVPGAPTASSPTSSTRPLVSWTPSVDSGSGLAGVPYFLEWSSSSNFAFHDGETAATASAAPYYDLTEGSWYFRVNATDNRLNTSSFATSSAIIIDRTAPIITLVGPETVHINQSSPNYIDAGATATDDISGNLTSSIISTNNVLTAAVGAYNVVYSVTDTAGNTATATRRVVVAPASPVSAPAAPLPSGATLNGVRQTTSGVIYGVTTGTIFTNPPVLNNHVVPSTTPTNAPRTGINFKRNLRPGSRGDDVKALQKFLNEHGFTVAQTGSGSAGHESTLYGQATARAVTKFQEAHANMLLKPFKLRKGTGLFYSATRALVNQTLSP